MMREEHDILWELRQLQDEVQQIKLAQSLAGDGWIVYRSATVNTWDINTTLFYSEIRRWKITFTPDEDKLAVASLLFGENNSGANFSRYVVPVYNSLSEWYFVARLDFTIADDDTLFRIKFVVNSTVSGTLSVVEV